RRREEIGEQTGANYCTSNADATRELVSNLVGALTSGAWRDADVLVFWMLDNGSWCSCDRCRALGAPTDRWMGLLAQVQGGMRAARAAGTLRRDVLVTSLAFLETMA